MLKFKWYQFSELNMNLLYDILALRSAIFVVAQQSLYLDPDGVDKDALHLVGISNNELVAYCRLIAPTTTESNLVFGRVVTAESARTKGYGKLLMRELLSYCDSHFPDKSIQCSAQHYLQKFYHQFGFQAYGDVYDDAGVAHIKMRIIKPGNK